MAKEVPQPELPARARLEYPFAAPPRGGMLQVAPGVHWIRLPMPFKLDHINVWALQDEGGWAIVDTGLCTEETASVWNMLLDGELAGQRVTRVFVTHMHPDHIGMAGWLTRKFSARLWITRLEYLSCRVLVSYTGSEAPSDAIDFCRRAGWGAAAIETYRARFGGFGKCIHSLPNSFRRLTDGEKLVIGAREWTVVVGSGHSPEHACLHCPELAVLISGDQILPRISSNVSVHPSEPDADPMSDWLGSLQRLKARIPNDVLVLPAHNECFRGLHERIDDLEAGQARALDRLRLALAAPRRIVDLFDSLFSRPIKESDQALLGLATGETTACVNHLIRRGEVRCEIAQDGVAWYRLDESAAQARAAGAASPS